MNIQLHSTSALVEFKGVQCRVWEGITDFGVEVIALIPRIAIDETVPDEDRKKFEEELREMAPPSLSAVKAYSLRQII